MTPLVVPEKNALVLQTEHVSALQDVLPKHVVLDRDIIAVRHGVEEMQILRNLGLQILGLEPMRHYYQYPRLRGVHVPMAHQVETAVFGTSYRRAFILNGMRTGKTGACLWAADYLRSAEVIEKVVILCTVSCMERVWLSEIFGLFPNRRAQVVQGTRKQRHAVLKEDLDYYILNHDGIKVQGVVDLLLRLPQETTLFIVDEGAEFRHPETDRYSALKKLIGPKCWLWWLTGTPMPKSPEDVWAQVRIVAPHRIDKYRSSWRMKTMYQVSQYKWLPKPGYQGHVFNAMQPAIRFRKEDVIDMPPVTYGDREAELTPEQVSMIRTIRREGKVRNVTAVNAAVELGKILQICAGSVKDNNGNAVEVPCTPRLQALGELIEQSDSKVLIFACYHGVIDMLERELSKQWTTVVVDGRVTGAARSARLQAFQENADPRLLIAHPQPAGHGLELAAADTIVWWGPTLSTNIYEQANNRIMSARQKNSMGVYHLGGFSLEWKWFDALQRGVDVQSKMLDWYKAEVSDDVQ